MTTPLRASEHYARIIHARQVANVILPIAAAILDVYSVEVGRGTVTIQGDLLDRDGPVRIAEALGGEMTTRTDDETGGRFDVIGASRDGVRVRIVGVSSVTS